MDPPIFLHHYWLELDRTILFTVLVLPFLAFCTIYFTKSIQTEKLNLPPSPMKLPMIGNLHQVGRLPHRSLRTLSEKYGPLMLLHLGSSPALIVSSAETAKEILKTHDKAFLDKPQTRAGDALFYGSSDIAFCSYGNYWRQAKKVCVLELLSQRRVRAFQFAREEEMAKMVEKIHISCLSKVAIDLGAAFLTISNDILSRSAFGRTYEEVDGQQLAELWRTAMDLVGEFCFKDLIPLLGWMDVITGLVSKLKRTSKALDAFLDQVIEEHLAVSRTEDDISDKKDLVDILLHIQKNGMTDIDLSRDNLKAILMDMFLGATDTTATTMEWAMAELVKNPSAMKKVQEEVRGVVGEKSKVEEIDIDQMDFLKCIVKETLRLHPPVFICRRTSASLELEGYHIPANLKVMINSWAIQRDPKSWDSPEEFMPERFANKSVDFKGQNHQFIPFGAGRRGCPGIAFAVVEVEYVLANILYWFDWELPEGINAEDLDMSEVFTPVIRKKSPLHLVPVAHFKKTISN